MASSFQLPTSNKISVNTKKRKTINAKDVVDSQCIQSHQRQIPSQQAINVYGVLIVVTYMTMTVGKSNDTFVYIGLVYTDIHGSLRRSYFLRSPCISF